MANISPLHTIRILLVDDHRSVLWGLEKLVASATPRMSVVASVTCGAEALAAAEKHKPDIVLLDLDLGAESGLELIAPIQNSGARVVILTGANSQELAQRAIVAGASGLVHKSQPAGVILQAIERVYQGELWLDRTTTAKVFATLCSTTERNDEQVPCGDRTLTPSECNIIAAVTAHKSAPNKVIADTLNISRHTLRNHLASIYSKLGIHRRIDLVLYAMQKDSHKGGRSKSQRASV